MTIQPPSEVVESQVREVGLLERPRGGHRGERVLSASVRMKTLAPFEAAKLKLRS